MTVLFMCVAERLDVSMQLHWTGDTALDALACIVAQSQAHFNLGTPEVLHLSTVFPCSTVFMYLA
jgi:hypothetical protein